MYSSNHHKVKDIAKILYKILYGVQAGCKDINLISFAACSMEMEVSGILKSWCISNAPMCNDQISSNHYYLEVPILLTYMQVIAQFWFQHEIQNGNDVWNSTI